MYSRLTIWWIIALIFAFLILLVTVIVFEVKYHGLINSTPAWIFVGFFIGVILLVLAAILYVLERAPSWAPRGVVQPPVPVTSPFESSKSEVQSCLIQSNSPKLKL